MDKVKGTKFHRRSVLERAGLKQGWSEYLKVMTNDMYVKDDPVTFKKESVIKEERKERKKEKRQKATEKDLEAMLKSH